MAEFQPTPGLPVTKWHFSEPVLADQCSKCHRLGINVKVNINQGSFFSTNKKQNNKLKLKLKFDNDNQYPVEY